MGSVSRDRKQKEKITSEDRLEASSFFSSFIIHLVLFLVMAIICIPNTQITPIKLELSFTSSSASEDISLEPIDIGDISEIETDGDTSDVEMTTESFNTSNDEPVIDIADPEPVEKAVQVASFVSSEISMDDLNETLPELPENSQENSQDARERPKTDDTASSETLTSNNQANNVIRTIIGATNRGIEQSGGRSSRKGLGDDIGSRLSKAGAKTGVIQVSLAWNTIDDMDLHVEYSAGNGLYDHICFFNRIGKQSGGVLDVDMNAHQPFLTNRPVENIFWPSNSQPRGYYIVYVHLYRSWTGNNNIPVVVRIKQGDDIKTFNAVIGFGNPKEIARFTYPSDLVNTRFK